MHTLLRVTGVLSGVESSVVLGLGFRGWAAPEPVHEPALVVPGHPRRGAVLQVGAGADRGTLADALGLVRPDRGLAEPVVQGVADCPDRRDQSFKHQRLAVMYCGVLRIQPVVATRCRELECSWSASTSAGVLHPSDLRGRLLSASATA